MRTFVALALTLAASLAGAAEIRIPEGFVRSDQASAPAAARAAPGTALREARPPARVPEAALPAVEAEGGAARTDAAGSRPETAAAERCRPERSRYLGRVLRLAGVEVDDPLAFLEGLAGPGGLAPALLYSPHGLLPGFDPIRPLAYDFEAQNLARDLAECARAAAASGR
jgi:hypothetical protein